MAMPVLLSAKMLWRDLPPLPQAVGGQFVGHIDGNLVVAGGSHWTGVPRPWEGGKKIWVDSVYALAHDAGSWRLVGHLPHAMGYGVAISQPGYMLCIGGQTPDSNVATSYRLRLKSGKLVIDELAPLPQAAANMAGAVVGDTVYVAGGQATPVSTSSLRTFWSLSLSDPNAKWRILDGWPGSAAILPIAAGGHDIFYLLGGAELTGLPGPPLGRRFLSDAFGYRPGHGWEKLPDIPRRAQAGFAITDGDDLLLIGGSDGALADRELELKDNHPGFNRDILRYSSRTRKWTEDGAMPISLVTSGITNWGNEWVIAGGEDRPAHRSARVIAGRKE